jgi:hypothetical protein
MQLTEISIIEFFKYLKEHPLEHSIPKRYVNRIRNLLYQYFVGHHHFPGTVEEQIKQKRGFNMDSEKAIILTTVDAKVFSEMPNSGPLLAQYLTSTVIKFS